MTERINDMTYTAAYDLGLADAMAHQRPRHSAPRASHASVGRFGYSDGFADGLVRRKKDEGVTVRPDSHPALTQWAARNIEGDA